jgi:hypothetical protein
MYTPRPNRVGYASAVAGSIGALFICIAAMAADTAALDMQGTWVMSAAYEITADGKRTTNYGEHPNGLLIVDTQGRYSLQIFKPDRPRFAAGVKSQGTFDELRAAALGSSTHTGRIEVDATHRKLTFKIATSSYPNWEGTEQVRDYTFDDGTLTYSVPANASGNGTVAYSIWRRAQS